MVILILILTVVQVGLGLAIGWWYRGHRTPNSNLHAQRASLALKTLHDLTLGIRKDVTNHQERLESLQSSLVKTSSEKNLEDPEQKKLLETIGRVLKTNEQLQNRLIEAQCQLTEEKEKVHNHMVEARTDALTGVSNRRAFEDELTRRFQEWKDREIPFSVMMIDVDYFKKFNDSHGHQAGDKVLRNVAQVLFDTMRDADIVSRYGGEEFAVIFPKTKLEAAKIAAERARAAVASSQLEIDGKCLGVTVSEGIASVLPDEDVKKLLERADKALYASKESGRNAAFLHDGKKCIPIAKTEVVSVLPYPKENEQSRVPCGPENAVSSDSKTSQVTEEQLIQQVNSLLVDLRTDPLTGLPSQKAFFEDLHRRYSEWLRFGTDLSLLMVEVDNISEHRKAFGLETGNLVVRAVTQFLTTAMRDSDLVARYDDNRFIMMLPITSLSNAIRAGERIRNAIALCKMKQDDREISFTISIGAAQVNKTWDEDEHWVVTRASQALNEACRQGRNQTFYHTGNHSEPAAQLFQTPTHT